MKTVSGDSLTVSSKRKTMSQESANWCRFAQLIINKGANVLRTFIQLEILTSIFSAYSSAWMKRMNAMNLNYTKMLRDKLDYKVENKPEKTLKNLRDSWVTSKKYPATMNVHIDQLTEWKKDIEQKQKNPVSVGVKNRLEKWLKEIEQEIQTLNKRYSVICKWNDAFLSHLFNFQRDMFLRVKEWNVAFLNHLHDFKRDMVLLVEAKYRFLEIHPKSKWTPSPGTLPQRVIELKNDLQVWKKYCEMVLPAFIAECDKLISSGQKEATDDIILIEFLGYFRKDITDISVKSQVDTLCDSWYSELEDVFRKCENNDYEEAIKMLDTIPSFRDMKIKQFFSLLIDPSETRKNKRMFHLFSKFKKVYRVEDLENLDLTLLVEALKEGNVVHFHSPYWDEDVPNWDKSTGADILRLKSYRNDLVAHIQEAKISSGDFNMFWDNVKRLLCNIALRCGDNFKTEISREIDTMKTLPLEPQKIEHLRHEYTQWCKQDIQLEFPSHLQEMLDHIRTAEQNMEKVYSCPRCNKQCSTEWELERHRMASHVYSCPSCNKQCSTKTELEAHRMTSHDSGAVGVAAGASAGAAVGLVLGPPGAVVGAAIGGLVGFFSLKK